MPVDEILNNFEQVAKNPLERAKRWKSENPHGKVIGILPMYFPEEMIHATGNLPIYVLGNDESVSLADSRIQGYYCGPARTIVEDAMKGRLDFMDGFVTQDTCLAIRQLTDLLPKSMPKGGAWFYNLYIPVTIRPQWARDFVRQEIKRFKFAFEGFTGQAIEPRKLRKSIELYRKHRDLMKRLYSLRRENPGVIRANEFYSVTKSSMLMPKEEHLALLETLLEQLSSRPSVADKRIRLVLSGCLCQPLTQSLIDILDETDALVVDDDLYVGSRLSVVDVSVEQDPFEALADAYLTGFPPCPTKIDPQNDWGHYLTGIAQQSKAQGVITIVCKECEPHYISIPGVTQCLKDASIAELIWEVEPGAEMAGQLRTRVEAFLEMLQI